MKLWSARRAAEAADLEERTRRSEELQQSYRDLYARRPKWIDAEPCRFPYCACSAISGDPLTNGCPFEHETASSLSHRVDAAPGTPTLELYEKLAT